MKWFQHLLSSLAARKPTQPSKEKPLIQERPSSLQEIADVCVRVPRVKPNRILYGILAARDRRASAASHSNRTLGGLGSYVRNGVNHDLPEY